MNLHISQPVQTYTRHFTTFSNNYET